MPIEKEEVLISKDSPEIAEVTPPELTPDVETQEEEAPKLSSRRKRTTSKPAVSKQSKATPKKPSLKSAPSKDKTSSLPVEKEILLKKVKKGRVDSKTRQGNRRRG